MTALTPDPKAKLGQVIQSLARHLPGQLSVLLDDPRFEEARAALQRLGDPGALATALSQVQPDEAGWLAQQLLQRWQHLGDVVLEPHVAILAPAELWFDARADTPTRFEVRLELSECDLVGAHWEGVLPGSPGPVAVAEAFPPHGDSPAAHVVRARVDVATSSGSTTLRASTAVRLRVPSVVVDEDRTRLLVRDQCGQPGVGIEVQVGERTWVTGDTGVVELEEPLPEGVGIRAAGVRVRG